MSEEKMNNRETKALPEPGKTSYNPSYYNDAPFSREVRMGSTQPKVVEIDKKTGESIYEGVYVEIPKDSKEETNLSGQIEPWPDFDPEAIFAKNEGSKTNLPPIIPKIKKLGENPSTDEPPSPIVRPENENKGDSSEWKNENMFKSPEEFRKFFIPKIERMTIDEVDEHLRRSKLFTSNVKKEADRALRSRREELKQQQEKENQVKRDREVDDASATQLGVLGDLWNRLNILDEFQQEGLLTEDDVIEIRRDYISRRKKIDESRKNIDEAYRNNWDYARERIEQRIAELQPTQTSQSAQGAGNADFAKMTEAQIKTAAAINRSAELQERSYLLSMESYNQYIRQESQRAQFDPFQFERQQPGWYRELDPNIEINERMQRVITFRNRLSYSARAKQEKGSVSLEVCTHPETMEWPTEAWDDMWMEMPGHRIAFISMFRENFILRRDGFIEISEQGRGNLRDFNRYRHTMVRRVAKAIKSNPDEMNAGSWSDKLRIDPRKDNGELKAPEEVEDEIARLLATAAVSTVANMFFVGGVAESGMYDRKINDQAVVSEQFRAFMHPLRKAVDKTFSAPFVAEEWGGSLGKWYLQGVEYADGFKDQYDTDDLEHSRGPKYFPPRLYCSIFEIASFVRGEHINETFAQAILNTNGGELVSLEEGLVDLANPESLRPIDLGETSRHNLWGAQYADVMDSVTKVFAVMSGRAVEAKITRSGLANALAKIRKQNPQFEMIFTEEDLLMACVVGLTSLYTDTRDSESGGPMEGSYRKGGKEFLINAPLDIYDIIVDKATKEPRLFINNRGIDIRSNILKRLKANDESKFSLLTILSSWIGSKGTPKLTERSDMYAEAISNQNKMRRQEHFELK